MNLDDAKMASRRNIVATLLHVEAAALFALGAFMLIKAIGNHLEAPLALAGVVIFAILGGLALLLCARGFRAGRNYGRAPAILLNLIALGVAYFQVQAHLWLAAVPMGVIAFITLGFALSIIPTAQSPEM
jgi:putative Mn2+ efflux pump MntP